MIMLKKYLLVIIAIVRFSGKDFNKLVHLLEYNFKKSSFGRCCLFTKLVNQVTRNRSKQ